MEVNINEVVSNERMMICPFDDTHRIRAKKFNHHVHKCRMSNKDKDFVSCPYNGTHLILRHLLRQHICVCPDRQQTIDQEIYNGCEETGEGRRQMGNISLPPPRENRMIDEHYTEDWDNDDDNENTTQENDNTLQPSFLRDKTTPSISSQDNRLSLSKSRGRLIDIVLNRGDLSTRPGPI